VKTYLSNAATDLLPGKVVIRWRKASATWVIYLAGHVVESGFGSEADAEHYLAARLPNLLARWRTRPEKIPILGDEGTPYETRED
jgi:hypothetical protein